MKTCPDCGTQNPVDQPFCSSCGWRFRDPTRLAEDTIPEGHPAVPKRPPTKEEIPEVVHDDEQVAWLPWFLGAIAVAVAGLLVFSLLVPSEDRVSLGQDAIVLVDGGEVETALSGDARALMLIACERLEKNKDNCTEEALFMGEFPSRIVTVPPFKIDAYEVRNVAYDKCVAQGVCGDGECVVYTHDGKQFDSKAPKTLSKKAFPKVCVAFEDAQKFCTFRGGTLPTSEQFIATAREGTTRTFPWGDHWDPKISNWAERDLLQTPVLGQIDGYGFTAPPGSYPDGCTAAGVCDLSGNVAEWVVGSDGKSKIQGGAWTDRPFDLRVTKSTEEARARTDVGFRCVYDASFEPS